MNRPVQRTVSFEVDLPVAVPGAGFVDPHVKLADLNGDRMLDLVYVLEDSVTYWPSLGWGASATRWAWEARRTSRPARRRASSSPT